MVRTQIYLDDVIHARLRELARKQRRTLSALVRDALDRMYGAGSPDERLETLKSIQGIWKDREDMGTSRAYVRRLRSDTNRKHKPPS